MLSLAFFRGQKGLNMAAQENQACKTVNFYTKKFRLCYDTYINTVSLEYITGYSFRFTAYCSDLVFRYSTVM
jgi:hypothetical protein